MLKFVALISLAIFVAVARSEPPFRYNAFATPTNNTGTTFSLLKDGAGNIIQTGGPNSSYGAVYAGKKPNGKNFFCIDLGAFGHQCTDETGSYNSIPTGNPAAPYVCAFNATNNFDHELASMGHCTRMPQTIAERGLPGLAGQYCYFCTYLDAGSIGAAPIASQFCVTDLLGSALDNRLVLWRAEQVYRPRVEVAPGVFQCVGDVGVKALIQVHVPEIGQIPSQATFWNKVQTALGPKAAACAAPVPANVQFCYA